MLNYATIGSNDLPRARAFYDALLEPEGFVTSFEHPTGGKLYRDPTGSAFGVLAPNDGGRATAGNGSMFGFQMKSRAAVDAFHARALSLGGTDEGAPGIRGGEGSPAYFAYMRDPEGNKLCAFVFGG